MKKSTYKILQESLKMAHEKLDLVGTSVEKLQAMSHEELLTKFGSFAIKSEKNDRDRLFNALIESKQILLGKIGREL